MFQDLTVDEYRTFTDTLSRAAHKARRLRNFIDESFAVSIETNRLWEDASNVAQECSEALHWVCFDELRRYNNEAWMSSQIRLISPAQLYAAQQKAIAEGAFDTND